MPFVVQSGNKQYIVNQGQQFVVDRINFVNNGDFVELPVLHVFGQDEPKSSIKAKIVSHVKGTKIRVVKYRAKSNYHRQYGFRPFQTILEIEGEQKITAKKSEASEEKPKKSVTKKVSKIKE